jgi:hypothetical protein
MSKNTNEKIDKLIQFSDDILRLPDLLDQHLKPCGDDLILLTLKGHLIIENLLEMNLCRLLAINSLPEKDNAKLEFHQKLKLVEAVVIAREPNPNADLFCAIAKLNKIRNDLAHKLMTQEEIEKAVSSIIQSYQSKADKKMNLGQTTTMQLKNCIRKLCVFLCKVRIHFYKLERQSDE